MKNRCPFAEWEPLGNGREPAMSAFDIICEHTAVTPTLGSLTRYFKDRGYYGVESHFGVGRDGRLFQFQSLDLVADANLDGNWHVWSIENADGYGDTWHDGDPVPGFTEQQIETNIRLIAWLCENGNIPRVIIPNSRRGNRGVGWHRMGVPGYVVDGGERWSSAAWKSCPGDEKIHQIKTVIMPRVQGDDDVVTEADKRDIARYVLRELKFDDPTRYPKGAGRSPEADDINLVEAVQKLLEGSFGADAVPIPASAFGEEYRDTNENFTGFNAATHTWDASEKDLKLTRQVFNLAKNIADKVGAPADVDEAELAANLLPGLLAELNPEAIAAAVADALPEYELRLIKKES